MKISYNIAILKIVFSNKICYKIWPQSIIDVIVYCEWVSLTYLIDSKTKFNTGSIEHNVGGFTFSMWSLMTWDLFCDNFFNRHLFMENILTNK